MRSPLRAETIALLQAYEDRVIQIQEAAVTDLLIASSQPDFEEALASLACERPEGSSVGFRCTPMYAGEAVGPTREVRLD